MTSALSLFSISHTLLKLMFCHRLSVCTLSSSLTLSLCLSNKSLLFDCHSHSGIFSSGAVCSFSDGSLFVIRGISGILDSDWSVSISVGSTS